MNDSLTTAGLMIAFAISVAITAAAYARLGRERGWEDPLLRWGSVAVALLCGLLLAYRALVLKGWAPLQSHVEGLLLLTALLAAFNSYLIWLNRLPGVGLFAGPVLCVISLWAVCASWWTFRPFEIGSVWKTVHLISVYIVAIDVTTAAAAGMLWLLVDRQMRLKDHAVERFRFLGKLGNLESIEGVIVRQATVGFVLLTAALVTGGVLIAEGPTKLGAGWWYSPKVLLAVGLWLIYAIVMHVRFVPTFRGRRAAWLAIVGFVLMLAAMGLSQALPDLPRASESASADGPAPADPVAGGRR
ncbi:MAG: cytochrome c biogenesis protein CcsA [Phycisphaeraceae bacterium]|nr:cytochrome c biogenesis protein CcsA [Phycisphaeraceae bacterium]